MIVADDKEREWGTKDWEKASADYAAQHYVPVSMKHDFLKIYPDSITRAEQQYNEKEWIQTEAAPQTEVTDETQALDDAA